MKQSSSANWYNVENVDAIDSPALLVFTERVKHNIAIAVQMVGAPSRLRPHVKTHKCKEATELMLAAGITQFKCATIAESEMLGLCKAPDVLLAYQPGGPKLERFIAVIKKYPDTKYGCLIDNEASAFAQSNAFSAAGLRVPVYIDVDAGMHRTGIAPSQQVIELYALASELPGIVIKGLHAYDGHIRQKDFEEKKKACDASYALVKNLADEIVATGLPAPEIIMGGSPSFSVHSQRTDIVCSPGTFVYWDYGYASICPEQNFLPAAVLLTRVISLPAPDRLCLDLGHKSVAAENDISKRVHFLNANNLTPISQSEEHLVVQTQEGHGFQPGDVLYALPYHVCPTVALYECAITIEENKNIGEWKNIARDRTITC